jgi:hypothetical protein
MTRADVVATAPKSARDLAAALAAAGWLWCAGGQVNPQRNMLRIQGSNPVTGHQVQVNWENNRLHSCVVWDPIARETSLTAARNVIGGVAA